jgi:hypothetical protein
LLTYYEISGFNETKNPFSANDMRRPDGAGEVERRDGEIA